MLKIENLMLLREIFRKEAFNYKQCLNVVTRLKNGSQRLTSTLLHHYIIDPSVEICSCVGDLAIITVQSQNVLH